MMTYQKKYYENNREKHIKDATQWNKDNPEKVKGYLKTYYQNNCKKIKEKIEQYQKNNHKKIRDREREYKDRKRKTDLRYNLNWKIEILMSKCLKGNKKGKKWCDLVGYSVDDLIKHLEKTILEMYCWQDFLKGRLQIDHIIPISAFNFTEPEHIDFKRCWSLENLQLLPAKENRIKSNKLTKPFQPALLI
jgi:5-methylcytosine-specific restriction endonuclease McrA